MPNQIIAWIARIDAKIMEQRGAGEVGLRCPVTGHQTHPSDVALVRKSDLDAALVEVSDLKSSLKKAGVK